MKYFLLLLSAIISCYPALSSAETSLPVDNIVAVVNDAVITQSELNKAITTLKKQLASANTSAPAKEGLRAKVMDQLIDHKLELSLVEQAGLKITDEQVTKAIANIADQNKVSVPQLLAQVQKSGMSNADYRQEIKEEVAIQTLEQQELSSKVTITPTEVKDFMQSLQWQAYNSTEYRLEDIIVPLPNSPTRDEIAQSKRETEEIMQRIMPGVGFAQVEMAENSNNHSIQAGDLGWLRLPQIPPAFSDQVVQAKKNAIIGPIPTQNGFHIIRLVDKRSVAAIGNSASQTKQVQQLIFQRKMQEAVQGWLTKIRSEAYINRLTMV